MYSTEKLVFGKQTAGKGELPIFGRKEQKELYSDNLAIDNVFFSSIYRVNLYFSIYIKHFIISQFSGFICSFLFI